MNVKNQTQRRAFTSKRRLAQDLADTRAYVAQLERERRHDTLCTDLLSRTGFNEAAGAVNAAFEAGDDTDYWLGVIDLDRFKSINDTYGHFFGDEVLREVGKHLDKAIGSPGIVARLSGDEFAFLIDGPTLAHLYTEPMQVVVEPDYTIHGEPVDAPITVTMSIGIAAYNPHVKLDRLKHAADAAMYEAKQVTGATSLQISTSLDGLPVEPRPSHRIRDGRKAA